MRMSALVQWPLRTGRSTLPIFKNLMYQRREKTAHYAASAACSCGFGAAAAGTWHWEETEEERTLTATVQEAESDSEYEWDQVAQRFMGFLHPHQHLAPSGLTSALCSCGRYILHTKTFHWEGNEQILRDFDAVATSSSRPTLTTNLSGQGPSTSVNGQSSATTPKVVGSMLFDPIEMCWVHRLGDAFEEDPFATIDELEKLDEEE